MGDPNIKAFSSARDRPPGQNNSPGNCANRAIIVALAVAGETLRPWVRRSSAAPGPHENSPRTTLRSAS
jgi:hypothetical protein